MGYYLVDRGRTALEASIGYRPTWRAAMGRFAGRAPLASYLGAILLVWLLTVIAAAAIGVRLEMVRIAGPAAALLLLALYAGAAGQFAVSLVNWLCTLLVPPRPMMRLDFSAGIPAEHRTLVAVPALLTSERAVRDLVEQLELRYLANQDDNLWFALLSDFPDADQETLAGDQRLLELARTEIQRLNERYCADRPGIFYLLHRPRKWNRQQGAWMGEERKRGKLAALNRLLQTGVADAFSATIGDLPQLRSVRYVITLDSDTRLPRDAGRELVGCAAHPLNQAEIDPHSRMVVAGYAVLQPRVTATMPEAHRSRFSRLVAGDAGIDPYTLQTSDLYHDLFGQGSFIGKGIYDVAAFESACEGRFPENRLLSHDLIEGCFARSGLVNDVELFEGVPSRLLVDMNRRHRWIRGDWQIASWLGGRVPTLRGNAANPLSGLSRWKILDNLRRSLTPVLLWSFLVLGWLLAPALAGTCTLLALALVFGPASIAALPGVLRRPEGKPWMLHARDEARQYLRTWLAEAVGWCILPYTVHCHVDAIVRTLYRLGISRSHLLEWTTASEAEASCSGKLRAHYKIMGACTVSSFLAAALLLAVQPRALLVAGPVLLAWLAGPLIAWWISLPYPMPSDPCDGRGATATPPLGSANLALLRYLRGEGRPLAAARPCARRSADDHSFPHQPYEHRIGAAVGPGGLRSGLFAGRGFLGSHRPHAANHAAPGTIPGALLQLVQYPHPATGRAALCVECRQRQPVGRAHRTERGSGGVAQSPVDSSPFAGRASGYGGGDRGSPPAGRLAGMGRPARRLHCRTARGVLRRAIRGSAANL